MYPTAYTQGQLFQTPSSAVMMPPIVSTTIQPPIAYTQPAYNTYSSYPPYPATSMNSINPTDPTGDQAKCQRNCMRFLCFGVFSFFCW